MKIDKQTLRYLIIPGLFLIPFVPFLVSSSFFFPFVTTKAFIWRFIIEIVFFLWLILAFQDESYRPKKSILLYTVLGFLGANVLSTIFSVSPSLSFWSNFERMEGLVSIIHLTLYFVVASSVFSKELWHKWFNTTLLASALMAGYAFLQLSGVMAISQGDARVDGTFGNAIYLAVYMLFHIFLSVWMLWKEKGDVRYRYAYGALIALQLIVLYFTATRGAILGLLGGALVFALLNIRNKENLSIRKTSVALLVGLLVLVGGFIAIKDTSFVNESPVLARFSSLSLSELKTQGRYFVWPMAWQGFLENPVVGWGAENFPLVFQKYYDPEMYRLEPWFDRAHNIFLDWLVTGGIVGLLAYLSLYIGALILIWRRENDLSYFEKSLFTSLLAAYFFHNFFVFDHLISYILFFSLLGYIQNRGSESAICSSEYSKQIYWITPTILIVGLISIYFLNVSPLRTNLNLMSGYKTSLNPTPNSTLLADLKQAMEGSYLGRAEVREQIANISLRFLSSQNIGSAEKNEFYLFAREAVVSGTEDSQLARPHLLAGSFLSSFGELDEALVYLNKGKELMPNKQAVYFELGALYINREEYEEALASFKTAYDMAPEFKEAQIIYLIGAIYAENRSLENEMLNIVGEETYAFDNRITSAYYTKGRIDRVRALIELRKRFDPKNSSQYDSYLEQLEN